MAMHNFKKALTAIFAALGTDVEGNTIIGEAPFDGTVELVQVIGNAGITGAATNNRKYAIVNKGQAGAGSTEAAALEFASGVNSAAYDAKDLTLSATPANLVVAQGDVLVLVSTAPGTGIADPGGQVKVVIARDS